MAKKFLFALFLFALQLGTTPIFANAEFLTIRASEVCTAPAPDSFRITSIGTNFMSLAWVPAWMGATHTLVVQESDGAGGWTSMSVFQNIPGSTYLLDSLEPGTSYRCMLATECPNGEVSQFKAIIDGITLILDLTIHGRTPLTPQQEVQCFSIPVDVNWKGFKVNYLGNDGAITNQFEVGLSGNAQSTNPTANIQVKRVGLYNSIVAMDYTFEHWPDCDEQTIKGGMSFKIVRLLDEGNYEIAGVASLDFNYYPPSLKVCPIYDHPTFPWKNTYTLTGLIAARASASQECIPRGTVLMTEMENIQAQSPFQQTLRIFLNQTQSENEKIGVSLTNLNGQAIFEQEYTTPIQELEVSTANIPIGLYVLKISYDWGFKILKILKVE